MNSFSVPVHFFPVGLLALVFVLNMALMPFGALYSLTKFEVSKKSIQQAGALGKD